MVTAVGHRVFAKDPTDKVSSTLLLCKSGALRLSAAVYIVRYIDVNISSVVTPTISIFSVSVGSVIAVPRATSESDATARIPATRCVSA